MEGCDICYYVGIGHPWYLLQQKVYCVLMEKHDVNRSPKSYKLGGPQSANSPYALYEGLIHRYIDVIPASIP